ncbi:MAG: ATP-binding protein [Brevinematales bacterium]|nr:ATP-binding protein [Brevinematales bacterium]
MKTKTENFKGQMEVSMIPYFTNTTFSSGSTVFPVTKKQGCFKKVLQAMKPSRFFRRFLLKTLNVLLESPDFQESVKRLVALIWPPVSTHPTLNETIPWPTTPPEDIDLEEDGFSLAYSSANVYRWYSQKTLILSEYLKEERKEEEFDESYWNDHEDTDEDEDITNEEDTYDDEDETDNDTIENESQKDFSLATTTINTTDMDIFGSPNPPSDSEDQINVEELYAIVQPKVKWDDVIINEEEKDQILEAFDYESIAPDLRQWGIKPNLSMDLCQSVKILLYGPSGTGKTLLAEAIASYLNAEIFILKIEQLFNKYVGGTEKRVEAVFDKYYQLLKQAKEQNKKIIFFINEADQLFSVRTDIDRSIDKFYNEIQNMLLEKLENFEGILVATTNLLQNFDQAWHRRFTHIIKIDIPDANNRKLIWKKHLAQAPLAKDVDLENIAKNFSLTGGQIANIVFKAASRAAHRQQKIITHDDLRFFIEETLKAIRQATDHRPMGFHTSPYLPLRDNPINQKLSDSAK